MYAFNNQYNIFILSIPSFLICGLAKFALSIFYKWRLENVLENLEDLRQQQKEYIKMLKDEEEYKDTMEILNKYEDSTIRNKSFSRITQKKPNVLDKVADIVLGDDPTKMYALICSSCHYHNGMIHPEDDLEEYNCYNCGTNNIRKK